MAKAQKKRSFVMIFWSASGWVVILSLLLGEILLKCIAVKRFLVWAGVRTMAQLCRLLRIFTKAMSNKNMKKVTRQLQQCHSLTKEDDDISFATYFSSATIKKKPGQMLSALNQNTQPKPCQHCVIIPRIGRYFYPPKHKAMKVVSDLLERDTMWLTMHFTLS
jgi:hypothetical protein